MPIPFKNEAAVRVASYMVEVFWLAGMCEAVPGIIGVFIFMSTGMSNRTKLVSDWDCFFVPGAMSAWVCGELRGYVLGMDRFPRCILHPYTEMHVFLQEEFPRGMPCHAWAGFSMGVSTMDNQYHAVDYYHQGQQEYLSGRYMHYVLLDCHEPASWYQSMVYQRQGVKLIEDPPRYASRM